jgi:hypothetical protein
MAEPPTHVGCRLLYSVENNLIGSNKYPGWKKKAVFRLPTVLTPNHVSNNSVTIEHLSECIQRTPTNVLWTAGILFGVKISRAACHLSSAEEEPTFMGKAVIKRKLLEKYTALFPLRRTDYTEPCITLSPEEFRKVIPLSTIPGLHARLTRGEIYQYNNTPFLISRLNTQFLYAIRLVYKQDMENICMATGGVSMYEINIDGRIACLTRDYYRIIPH